jgi:hypothetical protein
MSTKVDPIIGNWYHHIEKDRKFEVLDVDEDQASVEIQYLDGDLDEIDIDEWYEIEIDPADAPDAWAEDDLADFEEDDEPEARRGRSRGSKRRRQTDDEDDVVEDDWEDERDSDGWDED